MYYSSNFQRKRSYGRFALFGIVNGFIASAYGGFLTVSVMDSAQRINYREEARQRMFLREYNQNKDLRNTLRLDQEFKH